MKSFNGNVTIVSARKMWSMPKIHAEKPFVFQQKNLSLEQVLRSGSSHLTSPVALQFFSIPCPN